MGQPRPGARGFGWFRDARLGATVRAPACRPFRHVAQPRTAGASLFLVALASASGGCDVAAQVSRCVGGEAHGHGRDHPEPNGRAQKEPEPTERAAHKRILRRVATKNRWHSRLNLSVTRVIEPTPESQSGRGRAQGDRVSNGFRVASRFPGGRVRRARASRPRPAPGSSREMGRNGRLQNEL